MTTPVKRGITIDPREIRKTLNKHQSVKSQVVTGDVVDGLLPDGSMDVVVDSVKDNSQDN